jgi:hypothetical protein
MKLLAVLVSEKQFKYKIKSKVLILDSCCVVVSPSKLVGW